MSITVGRNDPCPCGSGDKYKQCCWEKKGPSTSSPTSKVATIIIAAVVLVGLVFIGISLAGGGGDACPPGTTWSAAHGHCH